LFRNVTLFPIQKERPSNTRQKLTIQQVNLAVAYPPATPEYLKWSKECITFNGTYHPLQVPRPRHTTLLLEAQIGGYDKSKVIMDGGSGINLIFADTFCVMNRSLTNQMVSDTTFRAIVLGKSEMASRTTFSVKKSSSRLSTGHHSIMPYSGDLRLHDSWRHLITPTSS
jgi:hypothetical protein